MKKPVVVAAAFVVAILAAGFLGGIAAKANLMETLTPPSLAEASNQHLTIESSPQTVQISPAPGPNALNLTSPSYPSSTDTFTVAMNDPLSLGLLKRTEQKSERGGEKTVSRYAITNVSDKTWGVTVEVHGNVRISESPGKSVDVTVTINWLDGQDKNFGLKSVANIPSHATREMEMEVASPEDFQGVITFTVTISRVPPTVQR